MLKNFRTYQLSLELYQLCQRIPLPYFLKDQLRRASSSICLNLAEGSAKPTVKDRKRFYSIAFGSLREVQSIIDMEPQKLNHLIEMSDHVAACLYKLTRS